MYDYERQLKNFAHNKNDIFTSNEVKWKTEQLKDLFVRFFSLFKFPPKVDVTNECNCENSGIRLAGQKF